MSTNEYILDEEMDEIILQPAELQVEESIEQPREPVEHPVEQTIEHPIEQITEEFLTQIIKNIEKVLLDDIYVEPSPVVVPTIQTEPFPNAFCYKITDAENIIYESVKKCIINEEWNNAIMLWSVVENSFSKFEIMNLLLVDFCKSGNALGFKFVLGYRAKPDYKNNLPLTTACKYGNLNIVINLIDSEIGIKPNSNPESLYQAALAGQKEIILELIKVEMNINIQDTKVLRLCASEGLSDMCDFLITNGANVNALDSRALVVAVMKAHTDTVRILLYHGADPSAFNDFCFREATAKKYTEILELLYAKKTELELIKKNKSTFSDENEEEF